MMNATTCTRPPRFDAALVPATPAPAETIRESGQLPAHSLDAHQQGDRDHLDDRHRRLDDLALIAGSRLLAAYLIVRGVRLGLVPDTVGDDRRQASTIILPSNY
jgi:hypothetical protein